MSSDAVEVLLRSRTEARARRERKDPDGVFLTLAAVETHDGPLDIGGFLTLEELEAPPLVVGTEVMRMSLPRHQLLYCSEAPDRLQWPESALVDGVFWTAVALLRLVTSGFILPGDFSRRSWDVVDGLSPDDAALLGSTNSRRPAWWPDDRVAITQADCDWVGESLMAALRLRRDRRFHFGLEAFNGAFAEYDLRMAASKLWAGIEGLFGINSELRFRLSLYVATVLHPPGQKRESEYRRLLKLYDQRSKVVHGSELKASTLLNHVLQVQDVHRSLLRSVVSAARMWSVQEIESALANGHPVFDRA